MVSEDEEEPSEVLKQVAKVVETSKTETLTQVSKDIAELKKHATQQGASQQEAFIGAIKRIEQKQEYLADAHFRQSKQIAILNKERDNNIEVIRDLSFRCGKEESSQQCYDMMNECFEKLEKVEKTVKNMRRDINAIKQHIEDN